MYRNSNMVVPSFFKVLTTVDFTTTLRLPPGFSRKYELHLTGNVKVRSDSGRVWNVKLERIRNSGLLCLTRGWHKFAEDAALQLGEFLIFSLVGNSEFDVQIYETNFCERGLPPPPLPAPARLPTPAAAGKKMLLVAKQEKNVSGSEAADQKEKERSSWSALYFETCLKEYQKSRLIIPVEFARASGLDKRKHVRMEYGRKGGSRSSKLVHVDNQLLEYSRVALAKGWHTFRQANGLQFGKVYSFHFCPKQDAILVNPIHIDLFL